MCVYASGGKAGDGRGSPHLWASSLVFDWNPRGWWLALSAESDAFVCPIYPSVCLIFPVENWRVTLVILERIGRVEIVAGDVF